jgi:hypothetical protein
VGRGGWPPVLISVEQAHPGSGGPGRIITCDSTWCHGSRPEAHRVCTSCCSRVCWSILLPESPKLRFTLQKSSDFNTATHLSAYVCK